MLTINNPTWWSVWWVVAVADSIVLLPQCWAWPPTLPVTASMTAEPPVQYETLWHKHQASGPGLPPVLHSRAQCGAGGVRPASLHNLPPVHAVDGVLHIWQLQTRLYYRRLHDQCGSQYFLFLLPRLSLYPQDKNTQSVFLLSKHTLYMVQLHVTHRDSVYFSTASVSELSCWWR